MINASDTAPTLSFKMLGNSGDYLRMQACTAFFADIFGDLLAHIQRPKAVEVIGNFNICLRFIGIGAKKIAHLVCHFNQGVVLHNFNVEEF